MLSASLYILACSARNRTRVRLRRLKEPRYLIGAVVGAAYFYFTFFARIRSRDAAFAARRRAGRAPRSSLFPAALQNASAIVGAAFLAAAALGWLLPFNSGLLEFSDAEIAFLFPAPVSRRSLIVHRLIRSQLGLLFTALVTTIVVPSVATWGRLRWAIGIWLVLTTSRVYFTGVTLARSRLLARSGNERQIAWTPLIVVLVALAIVIRAVATAFFGAPPNGFDDAMTRVDAALGSGAARVVLWPFVALARPLFAPWGLGFLVSIVWALVVLAATLVWVLRTDEAVEEAAAHAAAKRAAAPRRRGAAAPTARATGLTLAAAGWPEGIFFWKNGVQTLRAGGATLIRYVVPFVAIVTAGTSLAFGALHLRGGAAAGFVAAGAVTVFIALLGPQVVRTDLRSDLRHLEVLKTWPIRAAAVVRGEMLWPSALLTGIGWLAIACATMLSAAAFPSLPLTTRLALSLCAMLLLPAFIAGQYLVHAATVVLLPAWIPVGDQRPRGLDAMGQRLIMLLGVMVTVAVIMLPGLIAGGVLWLAFSRFIGAAVLVPAALVCTAIVFLEVLTGTEALGPLYDQLDVMSVERAE